MPTDEKPHLIALGEGWASWRDIVLRGTGFPAEMVRALSDPELAAAADAAVLEVGQRPAYLEQYHCAVARLSAAVQTLARSPRFREAVTWQNPKLVKLCLDKTAAGEPRNSHGRGHEQTIANYLQRYTLKNDTIGFVGPIGWAHWADAGPPMAMRIGENFLSRRTVYFESWAIDSVARALSADAALRPWLVPRLFAAHRLDGATLHVSGRAPVALTACESELLSLVDGVRSVRDIAAEMTGSEFGELSDEQTLLAALDALVARALVRLDLVGTIEAWPERTLLQRLERIPHPQARERALAVVHSLIAARDRVSAAAGDDVALEACLAELGERFQAITAMAAERRAGQTYAGRTLIYEDTVRDARVALGPAVREQLSPPLGLLLDSARWLVAEIGQDYDRFFLDLYESRAEQTGSTAVALTAILSLATSQLFFNPRSLSSTTQQAVTEFQRRWALILQLPSDARKVRLRSADLAERVAQHFPVRPAPWATAIHHSPDFMLAAADLGAVERDEYLFVLGELHLSFNTMESQLFVLQHDDPASLLTAAESDLGDRRIYSLPPKDELHGTSRVAPPSALMSPRYTYWARYPEAATPPAPIIPATDLTVHRQGGQLIVRSRSGAVEAPLSMVLGEQLSAAAVNAFKPLARDGHSPRIVIDRLVIARESWTFVARDVAWAAVRSEADRFLDARSWWLRNHLPECGFYTVPVEDKPTFVDFSSLAYVNILAKAIRRSAPEPNGLLTLTEMLPDQSQLWLRDAAGGHYTSEFRILTVDQRGEEL